MTDAGRDTRWAWDRFWKYDRLSSFVAGPGAPNYDDSIAEGWRNFFRKLPHGSRILDICTGNGAIAVLAVETASDQGKTFKVAGADIADIEPSVFVTKNAPEIGQINFMANTPAECLPMPSASFDAVVSQFGIEYTEVEKSISECLRVLAPDGRLRFAVHAEEGSVAASTRKAIEDADFLLREIDLPGRAERCFRAVLNVERNEGGPAAMKDAEVHFAAFRDGLKATADRFDDATDVAMLRNAHSVLYGAFQKRGVADLDTLVAKARELRDEIAAHRVRQAALLAAAMGRETLSHVAAQLVDRGLKVELGEQMSNGNLMGYVIEATREEAHRNRRGGAQRTGSSKLASP